MILDTRENLLPKASQISVYIREHIVPLDRFIVNPTQLFMNNPNWIINVQYLSLSYSVIVSFA